MNRTFRLALAPLAALILVGLAAAPVLADRDSRDHRGRSYGGGGGGGGGGVRVGGDVRVSGGVRFGGGVRVGGAVAVRPYARGYYRGGYRPRRVIVSPGWSWGGGFYLGGGYYSSSYYDGYYAPPPPCYSACGYAYPAPAAVAVVAPPPRAPLPRFGLGLFGGATAYEGGAEGDDVGLLGRLRLTDHFLLEGELAKSESFEGAQIDRTGGLSLLLDLAPWSRLSVYFLAGVGGGSTATAGGDVTAQHTYGEVGVGLDWRIAERFSLFADLRGGQRTLEDDGERLVARSSTSSDALDPYDGVDYSRGRIGLLVSF